MQAGFTPNSHLGTPLDVIQQSADVQAYNNSFAHKVYKSTFDTLEPFDEQQSYAPRFRTTLTGPTMYNPPTGLTTGQMSILLNPESPEDSLGRDYTTFLMPGKPLKQEIHGPDGDKWTTDGPISVKREPTGKFRSEHGASTVARAEQEAASAKRRRQKELNAMFEQDETPYVFPVASTATQQVVNTAAQQVVNTAAQQVVNTAAQPVLASALAASAPPPGLRLVPITVPRSTPTPKEFMHQLGKLVRRELNSEESQQFAIDNALNITIAVLAIVVLILLVVVIIVAAVPRKPKAAVAPAPAPAFGGRANRLTSLRTD